MSNWRTPRSHGGSVVAAAVAHAAPFNQLKRTVFVQYLIYEIMSSTLFWNPLIYTTPPLQQSLPLVDDIMAIVIGYTRTNILARYISISKNYLLPVQRLQLVELFSVYAESFPGFNFPFSLSKNEFMHLCVFF